MTDLVIDTSVAIKWVRQHLWKKHKLGQLRPAEALLAAQLLERADVNLAPMGAHLERATAFAIDLDHPAYDCFYIALAMDKGCAFATADQRLIAKARQSGRRDLAGVVLGLNEAAASL